MVWWVGRYRDDLLVASHAYVCLFDQVCWHYWRHAWTCTAWFVSYWTSYWLEKPVVVQHLIVLRWQEPLRSWIHVVFSPVEFNEGVGSVYHFRLKAPSDNMCSPRESTVQMFAMSCQQMHSCVFVFVFSSDENYTSCSYFPQVSFLFPAVNRFNPGRRRTLFQGKTTGLISFY